MSFNFPSAPTPGQIFTDATTGAQYTFNNGVWMQVSAAQIKLAANPQNLVVNGGFQISQENGTTAVGSGLWPADQWQMISAGAMSPLSQLFFAGSGRWAVASQNGLVHSPGAADYYIPLYQGIEGYRIIPLRWGNAYAIPAVLNFKAAATRDGVYGCAIKAGGNDRYIGFDMPITAAEGLKEFTFAVPATTVGTWPTGNAVGASVAFSHTLGAQFKAAAHGVWQSANCNGGPGMTNNTAALSSSLQISDVQLLADPFGTGVAPPFMQKPVSDDYSECQRYYSKLTYDVWGIAAAGSQYAAQTLQFPVPMRITPTAGVIAAGTSGNVTSTAFAVANPTSIRQEIISTGSGQFWISGRTTSFNARV